MRVPVYSLGILVLSAVAGRGDTVATFADPSPGGAALLQVTDNAVTADWSTPGLTLRAPLTGETFQDVALKIDASLAAPARGGGVIEFFRNASEGGELLLRIEFDSAVLNSEIGLFGASSETGSNVQITGAVVPGGVTLSNVSFSFALANPVQSPAGTGYSAAFTCSADVGLSGPSSGGGGSGGQGSGGTNGNGATGNGSESSGGTGQVGNGGAEVDGEGTASDAGTSTVDGHGPAPQMPEGQPGNQAGAPTLTGDDSGGNGVPEDMVVQPACAPLCGAGMLPMLPFTFAGLGVVKVGRRRGS